MEYRKIFEIIPWCCPSGRPGNCIGCEYFHGTEVDPYDKEYVEVICGLDDTADEME